MAFRMHDAGHVGNDRVGVDVFGEFGCCEIGIIGGAEDVAGPFVDVVEQGVISWHGGYDGGTGYIYEVKDVDVVILVWVDRLH